jgi:uncharacterized protein
LQKIDNQLLFSASDLTFFAECQHRTWLDRLNLDSPMEKAEDDEQSKLVQAKGYEHEADFFAKLKSQYNSIVEIDTQQSLEHRIAATKQAIQEGVEVIFQGSLRRGNLIGHSDFLIRLNEKSPNGQWRYEVADTKLARSTKAKFILQLCFYSDLLSDLTGQLPSHMHVELGSGNRETFKVSDYFYYYRQLLTRYLAYVDSYPQITPPYPSPCAHCSLCPWRDRCEAKRIADDHLSLVANITKQQIIKLEDAGINTLEKLAKVSQDTKVDNLPDDTFKKLQEQAALQFYERETGEQKAILLPTEVNKGFARLPKPCAGDLFFDMEGNPMHDGGLEYLFGIYYFEGKEPQFKAFWGHDRAQEREAFIAFMEFVAERMARYPDMHIYHYANYEKAALSRLMTLHGVKEAAVDDLLRGKKLVDLYKVVREGLRISKPSYSIKAVEAFYTKKRDGEVKKATDSIVAYEQWITTQDPALLESIRQYNEDDCRSTWQLREWLLSLRPSFIPWYSIASTNQTKVEKAKSEKTIEHENRLADFYEKLIEHPVNPSVDPQLALLIYYTLDFYRRADKPVWWALFDRQDAEYEELLEDTSVIAGLHSPKQIPATKGLGLFRYQFPEQPFKLKSDDSVKRLDNLKNINVIDIDENNLSIDIKLDADDEASPPSLLSISTGAPIPTDAMQKALFGFAESLFINPGAYKAVMDFLTQATPDIAGIRKGMPLVSSQQDILHETISVVKRMQDTCMFIQGPPGAGKTFTGSQIIASLLQAGKRIAISSNSHKAINNLLDAVDKRMLSAKASYKGIKKYSKEDHKIESCFIENISDNKKIERAAADVQLIAATAWTFARENFWQSFDYLFIDEAGQVSVANTIAMGMCAKNIVLLGDQMQLGQPIQGVHPGRSGESALEYLLNGEATIAPEKGIFLEKTYRMHPDVCKFISDAIYDEKLLSDASTFKQRLVLNDGAHPALKPTGISSLPVKHDGCSQRSEEEANVVKSLLENLLQQKYLDGNGVEHPFTIEDILVVAPYNMQVNLLKKTLPQGARVGTVDKFQGQEAQVVIVSMATSSEEYLPRFIDFLFSKNRLNVAISRARCLSIMVMSPALLEVNAKTQEQITLLNLINYLILSNFMES